MPGQSPAGGLAFSYNAGSDPDDPMMPGAGQGLMRSPFHNLIGIDSPDPQTIPPTISQLETASFANVLGWQSLPLPTDFLSDPI